MKTIISRTSVWNGNHPYKQAKTKVIKLTYFDYRAVKTLKEAKSCQWYKQWFESGTNHREENNMIVCDVVKNVKCFTIEINNLEDILKLQKKYGNIIIKSSNYKEIEFELEIYDTYRE